jgi:uncharacterized RDD family membrane protein YckC
MSTVAKTNPYAPPRARVRDVATAKKALVPADRSTRLGAALVDSLIFSAMVYGPMLAGAVLAGALAGSVGNEAAGTAMLGVVGLTLVAFVVWTWLTLKQMKETGQSLAKKYMGIKVVHSDGSQASLGTLIWKRNVLTWLLSIIPGYAIVEALFIFGEDRQCLHDKMADTIVVQA